MHVAYFSFDSFELVPGSDHIVQKVPDLSFFEVPVDFESILNFPFQYVGKVVVNNLF